MLCYNNMNNREDETNEPSTMARLTALEVLLS